MTEAPQKGAEPLPGYRLLELLGEGGYGSVWKARAPGGVNVALKFVTAESEFVEAELRALRAIATIRHPHLLDIHFSTRLGDQIVIATSLCDSNLRNRFDECKSKELPGIPPGELLRYVREVATALDFLNNPIHKGPDGATFGVQHRDVKPENIYLVGDSVKLADFGLAKALEHSISTHSGAMTPAYAAPEMFQGKVSSSSDQYSLAVTYCMLRCGKTPFTGTPSDIIFSVLTQKPDLSFLPAEEGLVVAKAMARAPSRRWPNCHTFVTELRAAVRATVRDLEEDSTDAKLSGSNLRSMVETIADRNIGAEEETADFGPRPFPILGSLAPNGRRASYLVLMLLLGILVGAILYVALTKQ